jgi:hypothetical protein
MPFQTALKDPGPLHAVHILNVHLMKRFKRAAPFSALFPTVADQHQSAKVAASLSMNG